METWILYKNSESWEKMPIKIVFSRKELELLLEFLRDGFMELNIDDHLHIVDDDEYMTSNALYRINND